MIQIIKQERINGVISDVRVSPLRDIAHIWGPVAVECLGNLDNVLHWPKDLREWMVNKQVKTEEVVKAVKAFVDAMEMATDPGMTDPCNALEKTGFFDCRPEARAVVVYKLGMYTAGIWWEGIRDATVVTGKPRVFEDMMRASKVLNDYVERPWWKRLSELPKLLWSKTFGRKKQNEGIGS